MLCARVCYYYQKSFADFAMRSMHAHADHYFEIMAVASGKCEVVTPERTVPLTAGCFVLLGKGCPHLLAAQNADILNLEFAVGGEGVPIDDVAQQFPALSRLLGRPLSVYRDAGGVYPAARALIGELRDHGEGLCASLLFKRFLIELCRAQTGVEKGGASYVRAARAYLRRHFCERCAADEIARAVGVNRSYLQTLFKRHTGQTLLEERNALRLEKACFLLRSTQLPLVDIAADCGFDSRQHFMHTFKKQMGSTAGEYRKRKS